MARPKKTGVTLTEEKNSPCWLMDYTSPLTGKRVKKTTEILKTNADSRKKALEVAQFHYDAERDAGNGSLKAEELVKNAQKLITRNLKREEVPSFRALVERHNRLTLLNIKANTVKRRGFAVKKFIDWLGKDADKPVTDITRSTVERFRDDMKGKLDHDSIKTYFSNLKGVFKRAKKDNIIFINPFDDVELAKKQKREEDRRIPLFREDALALISALPRLREFTEWQTIIRWGYYHGLRIGDCCTMKWEYLNFKTGILRFYPEKQKLGQEREMIVPIHESMKEWLLSIRGDSKTGFISPLRAASKLRARNNASTYLNRFWKKAGIQGGSFHGFRHGFISTLANEDISSVVSMTLAHHEDNRVHSGYTHLLDTKLREALSKIPKL